MEASEEGDCIGLGMGGNLVRSIEMVIFIWNKNLTSSFLTENLQMLGDLELQCHQHLKFNKYRTIQSVKKQWL